MRNSNMDERTKRIFEGIEQGLIDSKFLANIDFVPRLLVNNPDMGEKVLTDIIKELRECDEFFFCVAFLTMGGYQQLLNTLIELKEKGIKGTIIVSQYQNFTDPRALRNILHKFENINLRIVTEDIIKMHSKGYIFKNNQGVRIIIGSSNLTADALAVNKEWNVKLTSTSDGAYAEKVLKEFDQMEDYSIAVTDDYIDEYEVIYNAAKENQKILKVVPTTIRPNKMQIEALDNLQRIRELGEDRALVISSTGTGKTILSALDVKAFKPKKFLFVVHREQIAKDALKTFKRVIGNHINAGILGGGHKDDCDYIFSMIQTISRPEYLNYFEPDAFDYIVFDECHRIGAPSYRKVLNHFKPKFMLGMTATPERGDGYDIYNTFNYNIACDIRLQDAMKEELICPFHYYAVSDLVTNGKLLDDKSDFNLLVSEKRVQHIIDKVQFYGYCGKKVKGLVFVSRVEEAKNLSEEFNKHGFKTVALSGENSQQEREDAIALLESDDPHNYLDYIFTRDIFNEGIDIRCINQVVMLRPTESAIIFVQQLGRGLRKFEDKEYLVVLDFIGNYDTNFLIPIALSGDNSYNKDNMRRFVSEGNKLINGESTVNFERVVEQNIFDKIDKSNLNSVKLLKDAYLELKHKLGRIPRYMDYEKYGSIDVYKFFDKFDSYHNFLLKYDPDYSLRYNLLEEAFLKLISKKFIKGKRPHELELILELINNKSVNMDDFKAKLIRKYPTINYDDNTKINLVNQFTGKYLTGADAPQYIEAVFASFDGISLTINPKLDNLLKGNNFYNEMIEIVEFGLHTYELKYKDNYLGTSLVLNEKYNYDDVCRLLDFSENMISQNIGGYTYDKGTNTFPIFINYHKAEGISDSINYEDEFTSRNELMWITKNRRNLNSPEIDRIRNAHERGTKILLFVRKNKDDKGSKEFYFLGEIASTGYFDEFTMSSGDTAVKVEYLLETPVREELFDYIVNK